MKCFAILLADFFMHAYFRAMLILRYHSFGNAYFQERVYYRENTVVWPFLCRVFSMNGICLEI